jgi:hypothetical protein
MDGSDFNIDLGLLASILPTTPHYAKFKNLVSRCLGAQSCKADLELARDRIDLAGRFGGTVEATAAIQIDDDKGAILSALFLHAVILYTRATQTKSDNRRGCGIPNFNKNQKQKHGAIMKLRNDPLTHFGYGDDTIIGEWAQDRLFLYTEKDTGLIYSWSRTNHRHQIVNITSELIDFSIIYADDCVDKRSSALLAEMELLLKSDLNFIDHFGPCLVKEVPKRSGTLFIPAGSKRP